MKVTELKDWNTLTPQEQARIRDMYQVGADDELPASITKTMANPAPTGDPTPTSTEVITPKEGSTVVVNAENVVVNEREDNG